METAAAFVRYEFQIINQKISDKPSLPKMTKKCKKNNTNIF